MSKYLTGFLFISFFLFSCMKQDGVTSLNDLKNNAQKKVSKISATANPDFFFKYDAEGRLTEWTIDTIQQFVFDYSNSFTYKALQSGKLWQQTSNTTLQNNKVIAHNLQYFNPSTGKATYNYKFEFEYNDDGTLKTYKRFGSVYSLDYNKGNFTSLTEQYNGTTIETNTFEYYDVDNKFNIPYTEFLNKFPYLYNTFTGKQNSNLIKKAVNKRFGTVTTIEYSYNFDKEGYVTEIKSIHIVDNDPPVVRIDKVEYE